MKLIDVPVHNDDGSIKFTATLSPAETQTLLQFALNFLSNTGLMTNIAFVSASEVMENDNEDELIQQLDLFKPEKPND